MLINICRTAYCTDCSFHFSSLSSQFCASSAKEAEEWVKQIDFVLRGLNCFSHKYSLLCSMMSETFVSSWMKTPNSLNITAKYSICVCMHKSNILCSPVCRYDRHHPSRWRRGTGSIRWCWSYRRRHLWRAPRSDHTFYRCDNQYYPTEHEEIACISLTLFSFFNLKALFSAFAYFPIH